MRLRHIHIPGEPTYAVAAEFQRLLRRRLLDCKEAAVRSASSSASSSSPPLGSLPPPPTVLSFTPTPTYTLGRRQALSDLSPDDQALLRSPLRIVSSHPPGFQPLPSSHLEPHHGSSPLRRGRYEEAMRPEIVESKRGGLATYHGPRQVVMWPILDLHSERHQNFTVREYSRLLEETTISLLRTRWQIRGFTTEDPGVWVSPRASSPGGGQGKAEEEQGEHCDQTPQRRHLLLTETELADPGARHHLGTSTPSPVPSGAQDQPPGQGPRRRDDDPAKIAALGVHLRRHVTGSGVALNIDLPTWRVGDEADAQALAENPWARILACGLQGKRVTSVAPELASRADAEALSWRMANHQAWQGRSIAWAWAQELARRLGLQKTPGASDDGVVVDAREEEDTESSGVPWLLPGQPWQVDAAESLGEEQVLRLAQDLSTDLWDRLH